MNFKIKKSELEGIIQYALLILAISSFFTANLQYGTAASSTRYYCGYFYDSDPPWGVKANIYTISPGTILFERTSQWDSIVLSYSPSYWVQIGYKKWWVWTIFFPILYTDFYFERQDSQLYEQHWFWWYRPVVGITYTYIIKHIDGNHWAWYIKQGSTTRHSGNTYPNPYSPIDFQAFSETTTKRNVITGTHFSLLSKANGGSSWVLWDTYTPYSDPPYVLQQISTYEFKGSGGTG